MRNIYNFRQHVLLQDSIITMIRPRIFTRSWGIEVYGDEQEACNVGKDIKYSMCNSFYNHIEEETIF